MIDSNKICTLEKSFRISDKEILFKTDNLAQFLKCFVQSFLYSCNLKDDIKVRCTQETDKNNNLVISMEWDVPFNMIHEKIRHQFENVDGVNDLPNI